MRSSVWTAALCHEFACRPCCPWGLHGLWGSPGRVHAFNPGDAAQLEELKVDLVALPQNRPPRRRPWPRQSLASQSTRPRSLPPSLRDVPKAATPAAPPAATFPERRFSRQSRRAPLSLTESMGDCALSHPLPIAASASARLLRDTTPKRAPSDRSAVRE